MKVLTQSPLAVPDSSSAAVPLQMLRASQIVQSFLLTLKSDISEAGLGYLKHCFSSFAAEIDYERFASHFAYGYFLQNYWKACLTFLHNPPRLASRVLDAGCGSAAISSAYLAYLDSVLDQNAELKLHLVDRSQAQLQLAKRILDHLLPTFKHLSVDCEYHLADIRDWKCFANPNLVLLGHVLTENAENVPVIMSNMASFVLDDGKIYTIERKHDPIWQTIADCAPRALLPTMWGCTDSTRVDATAVSVEIPTPSAITRFLVQRAPENKWIMSLLELYFRAWREQSIDLLDYIFAEDAIYQDKPNQLPLQGLEQIREYWREKVLSQRNVAVTVKRCSYTADQAWAEWEASFERKNIWFNVKGILVISVEPKSRSIYALHEYYSTDKSSI